MIKERIDRGGMRESERILMVTYNLEIKIIWERKKETKRNLFLLFAGSSTNYSNSPP